MKTVCFLCICWAVIGLQACRSSVTPQLVGGKQDAHGCLTAAGYTWSEMRRDCVRLFEDGEAVEDNALKPYERSYVIFASDSSQAEVFRPAPFRNEVLKRSVNEWSGRHCRLLRKGQKWCLQHLVE